MRKWWGAAIIQMKLTHWPVAHLCCGGLVLIDQELVLVLIHCAGIVDSCSKTNSGTFCKTNHHASTQLLNKWMALKLGEEQSFIPKGEQPNATCDYILSINYEKTSVFSASGKFVHRLDIKCSFFFGGGKERFFHILTFYLRYSLCRFGEIFILSLKYFRENE